VAEAVLIEPVSTLNSLITGKLTGNFEKFGRPEQFLLQITQQIQRPVIKFPAKWNRECFAAEQGRLPGEQGIVLEADLLADSKGKPSSWGDPFSQPTVADGC